MSYLFSKLGVIGYLAGSDEEMIMDIALEAGADDVVTEDDGAIEVQTSPEAFSDVKQALDEAGLTADYAEMTQRASTDVSLSNDDSEKVMRLVDALEDLDDVQEVHTNADYDEAFLEAGAD